MSPGRAAVLRGLVTRALPTWTPPGPHSSLIPSCSAGGLAAAVFNIGRASIIEGNPNRCRLASRRRPAVACISDQAAVPQLRSPRAGSIG